MLLLMFSIIYVSSAYSEVKFSQGAAFRLRQEIWDDVVDLDTLGKPDRNFLRLRTQLWGKADFSPDFGVYLRLTNEMKQYMGPFSYKEPINNERFDADEVIIDNFYIDAKDVFGLPLDLKVGRQDFLGPDTYGEGFLLMDGTPVDGSRTFYFNAIKARIKFNKQNSLDIVYISDPESDIYMPSLHQSFNAPKYLYDHGKRILTTSKEEALVVYGRTKPVENLTFEPYYIYKKEDEFLQLLTSPALGSVPELKINTIGARFVYAAPGGWKFGGEYAHQWGEYEDGMDRTGNGGYIFVGRKYEATKWKPEFDLRYVYLSGNDPKTTKNEGWDPLFSRNPYWNEVIIYSLPNEQLSSRNSGAVPGYWSNMEILKASVKLSCDASTSLLLSYQYLWAPEKAAAGVSPALFDTGSSRGHLPVAVLSHKFSSSVDGLLQLEHFIPGDFYSDKADSATFFRWQLQLKI